ncbi:MAG: SH3 domain-containing protein [Cyanobacteriota bacterium]|nr:SH3 domain-containing protein [Cyanobacteriota bacterium]
MILQRHRLWVALSLAFGLSVSLSACQQPQAQNSQLPPQESDIDSVPPPAQSATPTPSPNAAPPSSPVTALPSPTTASETPLQGTYQGGGFTVTISGEGQNASYRGCDSNNQCLDIPKISSIQNGIYTWVNGDYTYTMSPESSGQYRLQVFDPSRTAIANTIVNPIAPSSTTRPDNPDFAREIQDNTQCSFVAVDSGAVNIRKGPGTQYDVVAQLKRGDSVRAQSRQGDWVKLAAKTNGFPPNETYEPLDGWISNQYLNGCSEDEFEMWRN